jgi:hypothetical protein
MRIDQPANARSTSGDYSEPYRVKLRMLRSILSNVINITFFRYHVALKRKTRTR